MKLKPLPKFLTHLDQKAQRALLVVLIMFGVVIAILAFGKSSMNLQDGEYLSWFAEISQTRWSFLIVVLTFLAAAFLGVPQWMLIAGVVVAFGPIPGAFYAWISTLISASLNFWIGRWVGAERVKLFGGDLVNRIISVVRKNGFMTSLAVRLVPTGPFVLVNMAAGVSHMRFLSFISGTAIGIIPKILIVAFLGQSVITGADGKLYMLGFLALAILFMGLMLVARRRLSAVVQESEKSDEKRSN